MARLIGRILLFFCLFSPTLTLAGGGAKDARAIEKTVRAHADDLDEIFERVRLDARAPGLVYGVVANGELLHWRGAGVRNLETGKPVAKDTPFRIASMTKMMTAQLVADLQQKNKLYLDAPAELYLPALKEWEYPTSDSRKITVRDLLNHTAGFVTDNPWADRQMALTQEELDDVLSNADPFSHAPGDTWEYSNLGFVIAGRIIETLTGETFEERLSKKILSPLDMKDSGLDIHDIPEDKRAFGYKWVNNAYKDEPILESGTFDPLGGMWTTADDYGRYLGWMLSAWPARDENDDGAISRGAVRSVVDGVRMMGASGGGSCQSPYGYAMGLSVTKHCQLGLVVGHGGGFPGYGSYVLLAPEKGLAVFAFANNTYASVRGGVWEALSLLDDAGAGLSAKKHAPDERMLAAYSKLGDVYEIGDLEGAGLTFANNFFLDRSRERWKTQFASIKQSVGACPSRPAMRATGRLSGDFEWHCANARIAGHIIMSPLDPVDIQELHIREVKINRSGSEIVTDVDFH
ncbi:MAG: serine hydrolase domain-containing protein [Pseudomonadota bacterium]